MGGHVFMKQPTVDEDLLEAGESHDLGESMYARPKLSKLKQEQFALVNAQSKLNQAMSARKHIEDKEAKQLELKEKTDVATEKLDQKSTQQNLQRQIDADVKQTTKIDEFMAHDNKLRKKQRISRALKWLHRRGPATSSLQARALLRLKSTSRSSTPMRRRWLHMSASLTNDDGKHI